MNEDISGYIEQVKSESNVFNKAKLLHFLTIDKQIRINKLASLLGIHASYVCHLLRLMRLPEIIIDGYYGKTITVSHLFVISRLKDSEAMIKLYEQVLSRTLTVVQTEVLLREMLYKVKTTGERLEPEMITKMQKKFKSIDRSIDTAIVQTRIRSKVTLTIKGDLQHTTGVLKKLAGEV